MISIRETLAKLASIRPIFHSEADFQHALAWQIQRQETEAVVRLELPLQSQDRLIHLDIWATHHPVSLAIELKYKTRALSAHIENEMFSLTDQSAQDLGRYDFIKDIQRLEQITLGHTHVLGYAILLTNDSAYWSRSRSEDTVDAGFRINEGRLLCGELNWGLGASAGTKRNRERPIALRGTYPITWVDYSEVDIRSYRKFRYCLVEVR